VAGEALDLVTDEGRLLRDGGAVGRVLDRGGEVAATELGAARATSALASR